MITPTQCRMARSALRWTLDELAQRAGISRLTASRVELGQVTPNPATLTVIRQAFEAAGIEFKPDGSVRLSAGSPAAAGS
jgi:transcriptional regulator with XRE-family HTH domain